MDVNLTRSPTLWTKVGAAHSELGCRRLTLYPYPTVNVQMLKLWDDESDVDAKKDKAQFRQYEDACDRVKNFYKEQHGKILCLIAYGKSHPVHVTTEKQTVAFNIQARINFKSRRRARMGIWEAMEMLNTLVDESDPDVSFRVIDSRCPSLTLCSLAPQTSLSQIEHLLQTAEAIRRDGKPEWMQVTGLVHDLGKLLFLFESEGQWDVVGVRAHSIGKVTRHDYTDTELFPNRTHSSSAAAFQTRTYTPIPSRQTQILTTESIRQSMGSTSLIAVSIMSCYLGVTMRQVFRSPSSSSMPLTLCMYSICILS